MPDADSQESPVRPGVIPDLLLATALLTRLPVRLHGLADSRRALQAAWAYPLVGAGIGLIVGVVYTAALWLAIPDLPAAVLCIATSALLTGALHEDGLADSADGLFGGRDRERRLEIMRDSRLGSYGALALILVTLCRVWALTAVAPVANVSLFLALAVPALAHGLSRWAMLVPMAAVQPARPDGLAAGAGASGSRILLIGSLVSLPMVLVLVIGIGWGLTALEGFDFPLLLKLVVEGLPLWLLAVPLLPLAIAWLARAKIGGYTGDILGAAQQLTETAMLVGLAVALSGLASLR